MASNKTAETDASVTEFINSAATNEQKRNDSLTLMEWMEKVTGFPARMWGSGIVGFGRYHYKYASGHESDAPLVGFSPRKHAISLYVFTGRPEHEGLLKGLGKFKQGKACLYVNALADIDKHKLATLIKETIKFLQKTYGNKA